jgi:hypothetical protein
MGQDPEEKERKHHAAGRQDDSIDTIYEDDQETSKDAIAVPDSTAQNGEAAADTSSAANSTNDESIDAKPTDSEPPKKPHRFSFRPELLFIPPFRRKLGSKARPLAIVLIVIVLLAGGGLGAWALTSKHTTKPPVVASKFKLTVARFKLVSTVPSKNATNVNTAADVVLNFNQSVTPSRLINNMFLTPKVTGTYVQGSSKDQIIFKPSHPFAQGTKVSVMINGTYQNNRGSKLGAAYEYGFTTSIPDNDVIFEDQNSIFDQVTSLSSGQKETYTLEVGDKVGTGASVTLYKGDVNDMLNSLVYTAGASDGSTLASFSDPSVPTAGLQQVSKAANITNNESYPVEQPDGLYVAVATNAAGKEVGFVWIDFSDFGVLARQDDQKTVLDAQLFSNSQDVAADTSLYNLNTSVSLLSEHTVNGLTTVNTAYNPSLDVVVATYGKEVVVVPVNVLNSGGDIRVDQNLSTTQTTYGVTDKPTYKVGDTIKYAGYTRNDNDAQYTNPGAGSIKLYIMSDASYTTAATFTAPVDSNGMFSGSIAAQSSWLSSGDDFDQFQIYEAAPNGNSADDQEIASFTLTNQSNSATNIAVHFSQNAYLPNNQIQATITGTNAGGQPLANETVAVHIFSQDYYENDPASDLAEYGTPGSELPSSPVSVKLNASGQATYTLSPSMLPNDGNSQMVSLQASLPNQSGVGAAGGDSAIVHQGDGALTFGVGREAIPSGNDLVARMYANHLNGNPMVNTSLHYQLIDSQSSSVITTGSATTDSNGYAVIDIPSAKLSQDGMELTVSAVDEDGNTIQASNYYGLASSQNEIYDTSGAVLQDLDISGSSGIVKVGDTVNLTINSPANLRALVTMDRGRIYNPSMLTLNKGSNTYSFTVTSDLAPSFTLTFNYFMNGVYHSEGASFTVDESSHAVNVKLTPSGATVNAGQPVTLTVNTNDNGGNPLPTNMIVDVVSSNAYDLSSQVTPSIFSTLFDPRPIMTSSSSSLSPIGTGGGGRCGGGGPISSGFANAVGTTLYWQPALATNVSGQATVTFTPPSGSWTVNVYAMSDGSAVGSQSTTITAQ